MGARKNLDWGCNFGSSFLFCDGDLQSFKRPKTWVLLIIRSMIRKFSKKIPPKHFGGNVSPSLLLSRLLAFEISNFVMDIFFNMNSSLCLLWTIFLLHSEAHNKTTEGRLLAQEKRHKKGAYCQVYFLHVTLSAMLRICSWVSRPRHSQHYGSSTPLWHAFLVLSF